MAQTNSARFNIAKDRAKALADATASLEQAFAIDPNSPMAHSVKGVLLLAKRQPEAALEAGKRAIELAPNNAEFYALLALVTVYLGDAKETVYLAETAMRYQPYAPSWYLSLAMHGYRGLHMEEKAMSTMRTLLARSENGEYPEASAKFNAFETLAWFGHWEEAQSYANEYLSLKPKRTLQSIMKLRRNIVSDPALLNRFEDIYRKMGFPDEKTTNDNAAN